jgi:Fe-S-cluster containining protein
MFSAKPKMTSDETATPARVPSPAKVSCSMFDPVKLYSLAKKKEKENRKFFSWLKTKNPRDLDTVVHELHDKVFPETDCLECANCCRSLGPRLTMPDIDRISKFLKIKTEKFIETYLRTDEDGDFVFQKMPCPFLMPDNYCSVYAVRPKACCEYPHTDRRKFHQLLSLTLKNSFTCPAVLEIMEGLKIHYSR